MFMSFIYEERIFFGYPSVSFIRNKFSDRILKSFITDYVVFVVLYEKCFRMESEASQIFYISTFAE